MRYLCEQVVHIKKIYSETRFRTDENIETQRDGRCWTLNLAVVKPYESDDQIEDVQESEWEQVMLVS